MRQSRRGTDGREADDDKADDFDSQKQKTGGGDEIALRGKAPGVS